MEAPKAFTSSFSLRPRPDADVPEDVDELLMDHLNDPYLDLQHMRKRQNVSDAEIAGKVKDYASDFDSQYESDRYSTSRAESRNSTSIEFDEYVASISMKIFVD
jgi:hypothetical protein